MYRLKVKGKDSIFTIPKKNICLLAMTKAMDRNDNTMGNAILCPQGAIEYLESIGIEVVEEIDDNND